MNIDINQLFRIAIIIVVFGIILLGLTYVLPLLGVLVGIVIVLLIIYIIYLFLTGQIHL